VHWHGCILDRNNSSGTLLAQLGPISSSAVAEVNLKDSRFEQYIHNRGSFDMEVVDIIAVMFFPTREWSKHGLLLIPASDVDGKQ
jgi:hypothetical protein